MAVILCATDGSRAAAPGLAAASALAARLYARLTLMYVSPSPEVPRWLMLEALAVRAKWGVVPRVLVSPGDPADALVAEATSAGALLVCSCAGHAEQSLIHVGGTAERIAEQARVPTLVVLDAAPFEEWAERRRPLHVVVGVNEGDGAADEAALEFVGELRRAGTCDVTAACVYDLTESLDRYGLRRRGTLLDADPRVESRLEAHLQTLVAGLGGAGAVDVRAVFGLGRKGDQLLEFAGERRADLLVVGAHRKGWLRRLSSVSSVALHYRTRSVACIPALPQKSAPIHAAETSSRSPAPTRAK